MKAADPAIRQVTVTVLPGDRLDTRNAAAYLGKAPKTLRAWRAAGGGPKGRRGPTGRWEYTIPNLDAWLAGT